MNKAADWHLINIRHFPKCDGHLKSINKLILNEPTILEGIDTNKDHSTLVHHSKYQRVK